MLKRKSIPLAMGLSILTMGLTLVATPQLGLRGWQFATANAQTEASQQFQLPSNVPSKTTVRIAGSDTLANITETLKQGFEKQYQGTKVEITPANTEASLRQVLDGRADLATIGRPLTQSEQSQGLVAHPIARHKIAIVTSPRNPFTGSITSEQFAKIFRGEIKDWSEVGGHNSAIRLVDQTSDSDTRQAFTRYPVFQSAPFESAPTASKLPDNKIETIVNHLGSDGISYVIADQAMGRSDLQILPLHQVMPTDQRYPFSQALSYVYKGPNPNEAVQAFLGYANAPNQNASIEQARSGDAKGTGAVIAANETQPATVTHSEQTGADKIGDKAGNKAGDKAGDNAGNKAGNKAGMLPANPASSSTTLTQLPPTSTAPQPAKSHWWGWLPWLALGSLAIPLLGWLLYGGKDKARSRAEQFGDRDDVRMDGYRLDNAGIDHPPAVAGGWGRGAAMVGAAGAAGAAAMAAAKTQSSRIILVPKDCQNAYAYWEIPDMQKAEMRQRGGKRLQLRLYDMNDQRAPHLVQQFDCAEEYPDLPIPIALDDHDYQVEIGYLSDHGNWLKIATSHPVKVPACERSHRRDRMSQPTAVGTGPAGVAAGVAYHNQHLAESPVPTERQTDPQHQRSQPEGSRVILVPRNADSAYAYWEIPEAQKLAAKHQGGQRLAVRLYDVTDMDAQHPTPIHFQQFDCHETAQDLHMAIVKGDREYVAEVGYITQDNRWLRMGRSSRVKMSGMGMERVTLDQYNTSRPTSNQHSTTAQPTMAEVPEGRLVMMSRIPQRITVGAPNSDEPRAYIYWDIPEARKQSLKPQGHHPLVLRVYDATDINLDTHPAHSFRQYIIEENARDMVVSVPMNDRDYVAEIGYLMPDGKLQRLLRSTHTHVKMEA